MSSGLLGPVLITPLNLGKVLDIVQEGTPYRINT